MKLFSATLLIVCTFLLMGCSSPGVLVSTQVKDTPPKMGTAPADGNYGLFEAGESQEQMEFQLKKGDPLGFDQGDQGPYHFVYAVAGNERRPLDIRQVYEWRRQP